GGASRVHPMAKLVYDILDDESASEVAQVVVTVGLAQNLGALKALVTDGIQKGHMGLNSSTVAMSAGASGEMIDIISKLMVRENQNRIGRAKELLKEYANES